MRNKFFIKSILNTRLQNQISVIELLQHDFGIFDWQEAENILKELGDGWRIPTINELDLIKPYQKQIV